MGDDRYIVATTTVWSGASYLYTKDAVKILPSPLSSSSILDAKNTKEMTDEKEAKKEREKR